MSQKLVYIFDLDNTLSCNAHRLHLIPEGSQKDWDAFSAACVNDAPKKDVIKIFETLAAKTLYFVDKGLPWYIYILSGRCDSVRHQTCTWLYNNLNHNLGEELTYYTGEAAIPNWWATNLLMREKGDYTPDYILKKQMLDSIMKRDNFKLSDIQGVFDDRESVVKMWRDLGLTCFQVAPGDF